MIRKLFHKLFHSSKEKEEPTSQYAPEQEFLPLDERFVINFKNNGGIFVYCETMKEVLEAFDGIIGENAQAKIHCPNSEIENMFWEEFLPFFTNSLENASVFLTDCEYLVAFNGSILISSNQLGVRSLNDIPTTMVIFAKTSQIINTISDGMRGINSRTKGKQPSKITTLSNFGKTKSDDFLNYGSSPRKLYLLLLEDLN